VIVDWVPGHFPKDGHGLALFDGTHLYEPADDRIGEHKGWGTYAFNYERNEVKNFLIANALFWFEKYHIDGIRVDAVASIIYRNYCREPGEWLPNEYGGCEYIAGVEFLKHLHGIMYSYFPGILSIAEESTAWPMVTAPTYMGGLGLQPEMEYGLDA
jgi:1,4-alpha-glucan branching enzyme